MTGLPSENDSGTLILVIGPHVDANADVARFLVDLGATPSRTSGTGQSAHDTLAQIHQAMLTEAGCAVYDPRNPPAEWFQRPVSQRFHPILFDTLLASYADLEFAVLHDADLGQLLPVWHEVADQHALALNAVVVIDDPLDYARTLHGQTGLPVSAGALLWASRMLTAERNSRDMPRCMIVSDDLGRDWTSAAQTIEDTFAPDWPLARRAPAADITARLSHLHPTLRGMENITQTTPHLADLVHETYEAVRALAGGADRTETQRTLDRLHDTLVAAYGVLGPSLRTTEAARRQRWQAATGETGLPRVGTRRAAHAGSETSANPKGAVQSTGTGTGSALDRTQVADLTRRLQKETAANAALRAYNAELLNSSSWKITAPLRWLITALRRSS